MPYSDHRQQGVSPYGSTMYTDHGDNKFNNTTECDRIIRCCETAHETCILADDAVEMPDPLNGATRSIIRAKKN